MFDSLQTSDSSRVIAHTDLVRSRMAALQFCQAERVPMMGQSELLRLQSLLGLGSEWGVISFPQKWMPPGKYQTEHNRVFNVIDRVGLQQSGHEAVKLVQTLATRFICLFLMMPYGRSYAKASSAASRLGYWLLIAKEAVTLPVVDPTLLFDRFDPSAVARMEANSNKRVVISKLAAWKLNGLPIDCLQVPNEGRTHERSWFNETQDTPCAKKPKDPYLPFTDEYAAEAGWRVLWVTEQLAPSLIRCARGAIAIRRIANSTGKSKQWIGDKTEQYLAHFPWQDPVGDKISVLPFKLRISHVGQPIVWPPRYSKNIQDLLLLLQSCHLHVFLLSTGGRISEGLSLKHDCIVEAPDGIPLANGRTYKLVQRNGGEARDWPLPAAALYALKQQQELAAIMREWTSVSVNGPLGYESTDALWTTLKKNGSRTDTIDNTYDSYVKKIARVFALENLTGEAPAHAHRYRKTIARLIALAIIGAPKIVMDLFGHRDIEMTLSYILTDPMLRAEMEEVVRAQTIMTAADAFENSNLNGGPAAFAIRQAVTVEQARLGKDKLGAADLQALAETATISGRIWPLVREGVVCTKGPQQVGPCALGRAAPEPSRCRSKCWHRLELYFIRDDVDSILATSVLKLKESIASDEGMQSEYWIGQICANISRFSDLYDKWSQDETVQLALTRI